MSSHKLRSIIAAAALAAGVSWLVAAPTDAATCGKRKPAAGKHAEGKPASAACGEPVSVAVDDGLPRGHAVDDGLPHDLPRGQAVAPTAASLATAIGQAAREAGLIGLASTRQAPGLRDLGGIAATWGMPSLASDSPQLFPMAPGLSGMEDLATKAHVPALPSLPVPGMPIPGDMTLGLGPFANDVATTDDEGEEDGDGSNNPTGALEKPVREVGSRVITEVLPKAVQGVGGTSVLPGVPGLSPGGTGADGLEHLVGGVALR